MKRTPLVLKVGFTYPKESGKSQPGTDLDRYIEDYLANAGLPVFNSCCFGRDVLDPRLIAALVAEGFTKT